MQTIEFHPFNLRSASDHEYTCLNEFKNRLRHELLPEDPPIPRREDIAQSQTMPDLQKEAAWVAWQRDGQRIVAAGEVHALYAENNQHVAHCRIEVLPEYRQHGLARRLLGRIVAFARAHHRTLLIGWSNDRVPAAEAFLRRIGARKGSIGRTSQLRLSDLDRSLIEQWLMRSRRLLSTFELGFWPTAYPEEQLVAIATLFNELLKDVPLDDLEMESYQFSPALLRQFEHNLFSAGTKRWTLYVTSLMDHQLVGMTELFWHPNRPTILTQGFTGVLPAFRNQGLGRWLKAEMAARILREHPEVAVIRTGNANSNAPMLKINNEMGFQPLMAETTWQVTLAVVEHYLSGT